MLQPGGYVIEGFAFDPTTPASQGTGIAGVRFPGDPDEGGTILGSTSTDQTTPTSAGQFGLSTAAQQVLASSSPIGFLGRSIS